MINRHEITRDQAFYAIQNGEFGKDILSYENVIIILTQDWCPQWTSMSRWIYSLELDKDFEIFELIYNKTDFCNEFMCFKEEVLCNSLVPYFRIYKNGALVKETNYTGMQRFQEILSEL